ncbi:MAG: glycosyltransferase family 1 protein, partial [Proteobacteria bacterium]
MNTKASLKKKILISINTSWNIVNFRSGLVRALVERGYEVVAFSPADAYVAQLEKMGCRHIPISINSDGTN